MSIGRIELIIGPMFAGKSTELIKIANRYRSIGKNILAINHVENNRYGSNYIMTHDKTKLNSIVTGKLLDIMGTSGYDSAEIILIEELQFYPDAFEFVSKSADMYGKVITAAGLSGDYNKSEFGDVLKLIPHAEKITKLCAFCKVCGDGTKAHFTKKIVSGDEQTLVGTTESYEAVCRKHYLD